jgi:acyl CoA:acetate/3-ketoacid CoA transferase beta subunit
MTRHSTRTFVEEVDFVTGQGYDHRADEHMKNEIVIVSNLGVMNFRNSIRKMQIQSYHPGQSVDQIKENTGFGILVAPDVAETPVPDATVVDLINSMDPDNVRQTEFR